MDLPRHRHTVGRRPGLSMALTAFLLLGMAQVAGAQRVRIDFSPSGPPSSAVNVVVTIGPDSVTSASGMPCSPLPCPLQPSPS